MGMCTLILGESGAGKSTSLRNFERSDLIIFNVTDKPFPFRKQLNTIKLRSAFYTERYDVIKKTIAKYQNKCKTFVIDDSQYLLAFEELARSKETGYGKFTEMANHFIDLLDFIQASTNDDVTVYLLHHTDTDEAGKVKAKTNGKMIDNKLTLEGLFAIVLKAQYKDGNYVFTTKNSGFDTVKTPMGMFEAEEIDNDLKLVDDTIREYYGLVSEQEAEVKEEKERE